MCGEEPEALNNAFSELINTFTPIPPPLKIGVERVPTFAVDLSRMAVKVPEYWGEIVHLKELLGHEIKHASADGLPYTYRNALKHEAHVMKRLGISLGTVKNILNIVYDVVVDLKVAEEGLDARGMCAEWLQRFPVTAEGSGYHLLQVICKDFFNTSLDTTEYEERLRRSTGFEALKKVLRSLASAKPSQEKDLELVAEAAELVASLSNIGEEPLSDVAFDRGDPNVRAEAAEIGLDMQLSDEQLAELMGVGKDRLEEALDEAAEDKVRTALWSRILGFKELFTASSLLELKEPVLRRWKPYSKRVDPSSVAKAPDDPRKWREPAVETVLTVEGEGEAGGFSKLILLIDCSGSTADIHMGRAVLGYIKDAAYGLIAYAKQFGLPAVSIAFQSSAWTLTRESRNYVEHAKKIFLLRSDGGTNLEVAARLASSLKPDKALVALITDGLVDEESLKRFAEQSRVNRVVAAVVASGAGGLERVQIVGDRVQIFTVKPDSAGQTIVSSLLPPGKRLSSKPVLRASVAFL